MSSLGEAHRRTKPKRDNSRVQLMPLSKVSVSRGKPHSSGPCAERPKRLESTQGEKKRERIMVKRKGIGLMGNKGLTPQGVYVALDYRRLVD